MARAGFAAPRRLIVNADDLGLAPEVDRGIERAAAAGAVTSTTLMVTVPHAGAGATAARRLRLAGVSVGLHVDLATGRPIGAPDAAAPLAGAGGGFHHDAARRAAVLDAPAAAAAVLAEVRAQAERFERLVGAPPSHLDTHKHTHRDHASVRQAVAAVASRLGVPARAQDAATRRWLREAGVRTPDAFVGDVGIEPYWTVERLLSAVAALRPGVTELMCHPGEPMAPVAGLFYFAQRATELGSLLDARLPAALRLAEVSATNFAALGAR